MSALLLHLDDATPLQSRLLAAIEETGGRALDAKALGPGLRLWARPAELAGLKALLQKHLPHTLGPQVIMTGSGDFHHISSLLIERALALLPAGQGLTVLHFDNHPDWVKYNPGLHCGSWAAHVAKMPLVKKVVTVGLCSQDILGDVPPQADLSVVREGKLELFPMRRPATGDVFSIAGKHFQSLSVLGMGPSLAAIDRALGSGPLYITVDKDVLRPQDALTNWDQGELDLDQMLAWISALSETRLVLGADVVGDQSTPHYGPGPIEWILKRGESFLDQPSFIKPDPKEFININENANLKLLEELTQALAHKAR